MNEQLVPVISIEGNIACGKSTMLEKLKQRFKDNPTIGFVFEPVSNWREIKDDDNVDLLTNFYNNQEKFAFHFQMAAYISRIASIREMARKPGIKLIVVERSIQTDKNVFAKMLYDDGKISKLEYSIYLKWYNEFSQLVNNISNIYIRTDPKVAHQRVAKRSRDGEVIPLEYLQKCHEYHDVWLLNNSAIIDGNIELPREINVDTIEETIKIIYMSKQTSCI